MEFIVKNFKNTHGFRTAVLTGNFNGKNITVGLTDTNTSFMTYGSSITAKGDKIEIADEDVQVSAEGRYYVSRISADKFLAAAKMKQAILLAAKADKELQDL